MGCAVTSDLGRYYASQDSWDAQVERGEREGWDVHAVPTHGCYGTGVDEDDGGRCRCSVEGEDVVVELSRTDDSEDIANVLDWFDRFYGGSIPPSVEDALRGKGLSFVVRAA